MLIALKKVDKSVLDLIALQFHSMSGGKFSIPVSEIEELNVCLSV
jgi:hypothetical protein